MKRIGLAVGVAVLVLGTAILAQTQTESVEQELIKLENAWNDALIKQDWGFLDKLLADDYISTDSDGAVQTKAQSMARLKSGEEVFISAVNDDFRVRVYGDAAVVTLRIAEKHKAKGKDISEQVRVTDTFIKLAGRWQVVAEHSSRIAQK
jgi:beta-glucosidase-like glycosyl hydrolase